jgi:hypothetical protein
VATLCTYCGTPLQREDARFCTNCGMMIPSRSYSPNAASSPLPPAQSASAMREQVELQDRSSTPPKRYTTQDKPPAWMNQLDNAAIVRPITPFPAIPHTEGTSPVKELHVKVWGQEGQEHQEKRESVVEDDVIDLPTRPLMSGSSNLSKSNGVTPRPSSQIPDSQSEDVEFLDTIPIVTPRRTNPPSLPPEVFSQQPQARQQLWSQAEQHQQYMFSQPASPSQRNTMSQPGIHDLPAGPFPSNAPRNPASLPGFQQPSLADASQAQDQKQVSAPPMIPTSKRKSRMPLVVAVVLLFLLAIGGVTAWIIQAQPFTIPAVTQPQQTLSNAQLGFLLSYPNGWTATTNVGKGSVQLSDSSQTDQVNILVQTAANNSPGQALQQEATRLKMTKLQQGLAPVTFAGTTWQQIKGSIFVRGATYTGLILVANHNNKIFTIVQMAPQTTFAQEDQLVFATMRSTFQFLT